MPCSCIAVIAAHVRRVSVFSLTAVLQTCPQCQDKSLIHYTVNEWNQHISWLLMCELHSLLILRNLNWIPALELPAYRCQGCFTGSRLFNSILVIGNCFEEWVGLDFAVIWSTSLTRERLYFLLWALWIVFLLNLVSFMGGSFLMELIWVISSVLDLQGQCISE